MKKFIPLSLAALLSASSLAGVSHAQMEPLADDISVVVVSQSAGSDAQPDVPEYVKSPSAELVEAAQAELLNNPQLVASLEARNVQLHNVVHIETAASGGKIVYVR